MSLLQDREQQRFDLDHQIEDSLYARNLELPALYEKFDNGQLIHDVALIGAAANNPRIIIERHDPREVAGNPCRKYLFRYCVKPCLRDRATLCMT